MKTGQVIKSAVMSDIKDEMALVNRYTRRELTEDEVYLFSAVLCDNEIDRDYEAFSKESLIALCDLFVGKCGITDHDPSAKNQKARIISCRVEESSEKKTSYGVRYCRLTARAYIPRNEENQALINSIDAGIVKEVSVGCSVKSTRCSVCGEEIHSPLCSHHKGKTYGKELCYGILTEPTDAYEFSFVAVPAQKDAGVIKSLSRKETDMKDRLINVKKGESVELSFEECSELRAYLEELESAASDAKAYREQLRSELVKKLSDSFSSLSSKTAKGIIDKLSASEMRELCSSFKSAEQKTAVKPQLFREEKPYEASKITQFTI